ncbi:KH domain-containing, RNA-binding, signal transduction-associated protein 3-like [Musca vetustissima]|uniref:KH domain-containing, RNA-binding, signal transduction-associated protein 3-like n=1 Tax=Musca vetustissima TaxID=27455 RepID=UPI002AB765B0|nr:KH domain-containing, RNA-binding, signal transduction-associated protein 3-like [Musca vetustissima]
MNDNKHHEVGEGYVPKINQVAQNYIDELLKEEKRLPKNFPLVADLIRYAIDRVYSTGRIPGKEFKADVYEQKPIKITQDVYIPVKEYPKFNFKGKILGPKGNTLKRLHQETLCSIAIKGRNSMRDQEREDELRQSGDPAFNHLNRDLYVEIGTIAPPAEAYARLAYALREIRKYIIPDRNDEISQEQYRELMQIDPQLARATYRIKSVPQKSIFQKLVNMGASSTASSAAHSVDDSSGQPKSIPCSPGMFCYEHINDSIVFQSVFVCSFHYTLACDKWFSIQLIGTM